MRKLLCLIFIFIPFFLVGQDLRWSTDGNSYYQIESDELIQYTLPEQKKTVIVSKKDLTPSGQNKSLTLKNYALSPDGKQALIYTNSRRVWRLDTQGDYWVLDFATKSLRKLGATLPPSSLRFAKFSPDGKMVAYVSEYNLYVEDLVQKTIKPLITDGTRKLINGTFDWVYEEEFFCRDGFQWSPDSKLISFWQIDARKIRDFYMINTTDSIYSKVIPVEYPKVGEAPSPARIGVASISSGSISWLAIPGESNQHYLPRMEWNSSSEVFVQQLNRKQNESKIFSCNSISGDARLIYTEKDESWIDVSSPWESAYTLDFRHRFEWLNLRKEFIWASEKDGWRHLYRIGKDGKEKLITKGDYDVMDVKLIDEKNNTVYFLASPSNATQKYLYKTKLDGSGKPERVTPQSQAGTHTYSLSPNGKYASHSFTNTFTKPVMEMIALPQHKAVIESESLDSKLKTAQEDKKVKFFKIKTADGVEMDGLMVKPLNFDSLKKYPVVFYVYTEPASANVQDEYGAGNNSLFMGDMAEEGYIYIIVDNRGTPAPKGRAWRKSIYKKIGILNIDDQAQAAREILKWPFVDSDRIAVWGWSGGGSATLNLMFRYPEIYKTGIAVAAVTNLLTYDNIYEERFMGLPQENREAFIKGSPITYAKNLKGNLLYIHGTGDDNVHYSNAEMLINELVKHNKQFEFMAYPNRSHSIHEGEGTRKHLSTLYTMFLRKHVPPGPRYK
jgi:dipeptidyl-peptidase-4